MSLIVQANTNSVVLNADSYVTLSELREYQVNRGYSNWAALIPLSGDHTGTNEVTGTDISLRETLPLAIVSASNAFTGDRQPAVGSSIRIAGFTGVDAFFAQVKSSSNAVIEFDPIEVTVTSDNAPADGAVVAISQVDLSAAEQFARRATDWIDRRFNFIGEKTELTQRLKWPREYASYPDDQYRYYPDTEIPILVKEAACMVAESYRDTTRDIDGIVNFTNVVKKKTIDVLEIEFDSMIQQKYGASAATVLNPVYELLLPLTYSNKGLMRS